MRSDFATPANSPPSDAALRDADVVAMLRSGAQQKAFEQLLQRYETKVFHLCVAMLGNDSIAEEVAQEALLRVWRSLDRYDAQRASLSTWIYAITRNRCLSALEANDVLVHSLDVESIREEAEKVAADLPTHDSASLQLLRRLVDALPTAYRSCLKLYYFEDHSVGEVATMLGIPVGTAKTHLHRARSALHEALDGAGLADAALWR